MHAANDIAMRNGDVGLPEPVVNSRRGEYSGMKEFFEIAAIVDRVEIFNETEAGKGGGENFHFQYSVCLFAPGTADTSPLPCVNIAAKFFFFNHRRFFL